MPNFMENSRKEFQKFTENSRASQTLFRGAMLMQTKKSLEKDSNSTFEISEQRIGPIYYIYKY